MKQKNLVYDYLKFNFCDFSLNVQKKVWANNRGISYFINNYDKFNLTDKQKVKIERSLKHDFDPLLEYFEREKIQIIIFESKYYPQELKNIFFPPFILYAKGNIDLLKEEKFAIVGSRRASLSGKNLALNFSKRLSQNKQVIVSGMAAGIDFSAHRGALVNGKTIAVMATGIDICYPAYNKKLKEEITENGLILTEFFPGTKPDGFRFPIRNRIISGLSWGVLVVEAGLKSGSMITAKYAIEQGKEVFAIPGDIFKINSAGTNFLIKNSMANMVTDISDILPNTVKPISKDSLKEDEKIVLELILNGIMEFDEIMEKSKMDFGRLTAVLFQLEVKNFIVKISANIYRGAVNG